MKINFFDIPRSIKSFKYALKGLKHIIMMENNFRIHLLAAFMVIIIGLFLNLTLNEWILLVIVSDMIIIIMEIVNTAIERIVDFITPDYTNEAGIIKDIGASAVFLSAIVALIVGLYVFIPKIADKFL